MDKTLSALVVHDLKNALALLEIDLEQLNHHPNLPPEARMAYQRCMELKNRLIGFLTVYKHDQSGLNPNPVEVELDEFIEDLVGNNLSALQAKNRHGHPVTVLARRDQSSAGESFFFDENLVELALEAALDNAIRYAHHRVEIGCELRGDALIFRVLDDGAGIGVEKELQGRNIADNSSSTGLGMALCEAVAGVHGSGCALLENAQGGGTLFSMELRPVDRS